MAVAGLHNVSVLENSFLRESQSQESRRRENGSTRASSLLQMWRELEDEQVVIHAEERANERMLQQGSDDISMTDLSDGRHSEHSGVTEDVSVSENEFGQWSPDRFESQNGNDDLSGFNCERSPDLGEVERERVRQIFQEWMNNGGNKHTSNVSHRHNSSRAQWLGETEQERVRIIREWVQMNSQQRGACMDSREEQAADAGGQIERVLDGLVVNRDERQTEHVHRGIRKLCGRQALLDMLKKAERERQTELQGLLEHRAVTNFAHRNRIQSLLRGRFLRNNRMVEGDRPTSIAATELGLLRQKQTVSGLREGFLSRLDSSGSGPASSNLSDALSNADSNGNRNEQKRVNNTLSTIDRLSDRSECENEETDYQRCLVGTTDLEVETEDVSWQATSVRVEEWQEQVSESVVSNWQRPSSAEPFESRCDFGQVLDGDGQESLARASSIETLQNEAGELSSLQESGEASYEHSPQDGERNRTYGLMNVVENVETIPVDYTDGQEPASQAEQRQEEDQENQDADQQEPSVDYVMLMDGGNEEAFDLHHEYGESEDRGYDRMQEALGTQHEDGGLHDTRQNWSEGSYNQQSGYVHMQEAVGTQHEDGGLHDTRQNWSEGSYNQQSGYDHMQEALGTQHEDDGLHDTRQNWSEGSYNQQSATVGRLDTFYFPDDDNVHNTELRELLSRRSVSTLLRSGFRESLDQLIQSYVERQNQGSTDRDLTPTTESIEQDIELESRDQNEGRSLPTAVPSPRIQSTRPLWDQFSYNYNRESHDVNQHFGIEWEIINDLRVDMARLQQRMTNMQRMLEACMDMQLELQRSIRQEVSAALNRSSGSQDLIVDDFPKDASSNWDNVRRGICCLCCEGNIDSLLFRCGHMCACSKCANDLVQGGGKCPMCRAPVVEVIRAYSIL